MYDQMDMIQRNHGVVRQAAKEQMRSHRHRPGKKMIAGFLIIALCSTLATAALVNYLSTSVTTKVLVESPITLNGDGWTFGAPGTTIPAGSEELLTVVATNNANLAIDACADLEVNYSIDDGATWPLFDFIPGGMTVSWSSDNGITWVSGDVGSQSSIGHIRFPQYSATISFPIGQSTHLVKILFHQDILPAQYKFKLTIRPASWQVGQ